MLAVLCAMAFCAICIMSIVAMVWSMDRANASVTEYRGNDWLSQAYAREIGDNNE